MDILSLLEKSDFFRSLPPALRRAGTGATISNQQGDDEAGRFTINTGTTPAAAGAVIATFTWSKLTGANFVGVKAYTNQFAQRLLAVKIKDLLRRPAIAAAVPLRFSVQSGHLRSALIRRSVNARGEPIPWYSYPAIDFLAAMPLVQARVLEFGSGYSTLCWADRAESVLSIEADSAWYEDISGRLGPRANVEHILSFDASEPQPGYASLLPIEAADLRGRVRDGEFDVVVVDTIPRDVCAEIALSVVAADGFVILDNSEQNWSSRGLPGHPVIDLFEREGFARVDFYGYAPGVYRKQCTSLFFKQVPRLVRGIPAPRI